MSNTSLPSPTVFVKDEQSLENVQLRDCLFLLKIGSGELQYAIYKRDTRYFMRLAMYHFEGTTDYVAIKSIIERIINENKITLSHFKEIKIIFDTPSFTLVPDLFFKDSLKEDYYSFLFPDEKQQELQTEAIAGLSVHNIFGIDKKLWKEIKNRFPDADIMHCSTLLLKQILSHSEITNGAFIMLHLDTVILAAFSDRKLLMMQPFATTTSLDAVYHILNGLRQQALSLEDLPVFVTGECTGANDIFKKLEIGLPNIKWMKRPEGLQYPAAMDQHPEHYFHQLASLVL